MINMPTPTLTNRLLLFVLGTLTVVLCGFSLVLYAFAHNYLHREIDERIDAAVSTLVAAMEMSSGGVEWEPNQRGLSIGDGPLGGSVSWIVSDDQGHFIDRSNTTGSDRFAIEVADSLSYSRRAAAVVGWQSAGWKISQSWFDHTAALETRSSPLSTAKRTEGKFPALAVTVGVSVEPVRAALRTLALGLTGVSLAIECSVLLIGRWICVRALAPVTRIAKSAEGMSASKFSERLPVMGTGDELDGLVGSFNGLLDRLQDSFDRQQQFTGDASHQLRTPLTAMLGQVEVALRRKRSAEEYERVLATVKQQAGHLHQIVESLLYLARADAGLPGLEVIDLAEWITRYGTQWKEHPRAKDLRFPQDSNTPHPVVAHPLLFAELLNNVIDNAIKYSQPGTSIAVNVGKVDERVTISVEDQGCGITATERALIFDPFYRSEEARRSGIRGTGLGLSIAARIAKVFNAKLEAQSGPREGTCIILTLPEFDLKDTRKST